MKTIYKYALHQGVTKMLIPRHAKILTVQEQYDSPQLWALVEESNSQHERVFHTYGTGHTVYDTPPGNVLVYIGSYQQYGGDLMWHVFEEVSEQDA